MTRRRKIYEGKAKILYEGPEPGTIIPGWRTSVFPPISSAA
jgi:phosphoribosylaminoimidazole-succinocarboxamide synthase